MSGTPTTLVAYVPSIFDRPAQWDPLLADLKRLVPGLAPDQCDWKPVRHGGRWWRPIRAEKLARDVAATINGLDATGSYEHIVLAGHSLGGLLVRRAYLLGREQPWHDREQPWPDKVREVVLFASMNRGVEAGHLGKSWLANVGLAVLTWIARVVPVVNRWLVADLIRGSDFIANLRLAWLRAFAEDPVPPRVVQILGAQDALVGEDDSRDVLADGLGAQVSIGGADHADIVALRRLDPESREQALSLITRAAFRTEEWAAHRQARAAAAGGGPRQAVDKTVVVLLHGIRASRREWAVDLAEVLRDAHAARGRGEGFAILRSEYKRFSAPRFALPSVRRKNIGWFQDQYSQLLAEDPRTRFHFVGHSNGTYILGESLRNLPEMRFDRVYLAGSVLPQSFDWGLHLGRGQVTQVRNACASRDYPVGLLCPLLVGLAFRKRKKDIGTAGVDGFSFDHPGRQLHEIAYFQGGHGKAVERGNHAAIARFIIDGADDPAAVADRGPSVGFSLASRLARMLAKPLALLLIAGLVYLWWAVLPWSPLVNAGVLVGALALLVVVGDAV